MTDAETILKLIETVDPTDMTKLDEIDARVWCWLMNKEYLGDSFYFKGEQKVTIPLAFKTLFGQASSTFAYREKYTRSRDALKAIRPQCYIVVGNCQNNPDEFRCELLLNYKTPTIYAYGKTEELAELHAIIQAIDYERRSSKDHPNN